MTPELFQRLQEGERQGRAPKKGMLYCPYCETWSYWKPDEYDYKRAECCGISDSDYYVKKYNGTW